MEKNGIVNCLEKACKILPPMNSKVKTIAQAVEKPGHQIKSMEAEIRVEKHYVLR